MNLANLLDRAQQARNRNIPVTTEFLSPSQQVLAREALALSGTGESEYLMPGGYDGAERKLVLFLPDWMDASMAESECGIRCIRAAFRAEEKLSHRDLLGSLMGMGIVRERIGDILVSPGSADVLVLESTADYLLQSWSSAGRAKLQTQEVPLSHIHIPTAAVKEIRDTVSSLRLDAVLSSGLQMARGKAADLVSAGRVEVNWRECTKTDRLLEQGDTISARGFGKFELMTVGGLTKKGRISIVLKRYV